MLSNYAILLLFKSFTLNIISLLFQFKAALVRLIKEIFQMEILGDNQVGGATAKTVR